MNLPENVNFKICKVVLFLAFTLTVQNVPLKHMNLSNLLASLLTWAGKSPWRRKWQPTPVFLPGNSHGWRSLVGYNPWGRKELDTTEQLHFHLFLVSLLDYLHFLLHYRNYPCAKEIIACSCASSDEDPPALFSHPHFAGCHALCL